MQDWIAENFIWVITAAFGAGGFVWMMRQLVTRFDKHEASMSERLDGHEERIDKRFDDLAKNVASHSKDISSLQSRMARQEERTEVLSEMRGQISDIWKQIMRSGGGGGQ